MVDSLTPERRSALMASVKHSDTKPEVTLRKALHKLGLRYVIGDKRLPGTPDIVFPKHNVAVFVHGCFWHGHVCRQGRLPTSNIDYWAPKIEANRARDKRKAHALNGLGWRVYTVWECELNSGKKAECAEMLASKIKGGGEDP